MKFLIKSVTSILIFSTVLSLGSCGNTNSNNNQPEVVVADGDLQGDISISGAFALYPLAVKWADEFKTLHPGVRIDISAGGAGKGMTDVLAKVVDLGMVSREIYPQEIEKGALGFAVAKDAVVPTINVNNPALKNLLKVGLSKKAAQELWLTGKYKTWGDVMKNSDKTPVRVYTRSDACGAAETWALWLGAKQEDLLGTAVFGDPGVAQAVQNDKLAIGLNNIGYAYDENSRKPNPGIVVLPVDANDNGKIDPEELFYDTKDNFIKAVAEDKYPSPPARDLYLVTNGVPTNPIVIEFLKYILTDGQAQNIPTGYIGISEDKLNAGLELLK